jgi:Gpi18-like mannosyltransferase/4-amino-4-deoxy-L-arabinose transferase-like glycosyltransferase
MTNADPTHPLPAIQCEARAARSYGAALAALCAVAVLLAAATGARAQSLVRNGAFTDGSGDAPAEWTTDQWSTTLGTTFEWRRSPSGPGVVAIRNPAPNDARWTQTVRVQPDTWYRLSGWVRAVGVSTSGFGGSLAVLGGFENTREIEGPDSGWQAVSMWIKSKPGQTQMTVACRLGNYGQIAAGEVQCTGIELTPVGTPPLNADYVYGPLDEVTTPVGLPAAAGIVVLLALALWLYGRVPAEVALGERLALLGILVALLAVKLLVAPHFQYRVDVGSYSAWAMKLAAEGPGRFYAPGYFADYPPGYMYVLWGIGLVGRGLSLAWQSASFVALLKLPALLADLAVAHLIFVRLRPGRRRLAWIAALAFALNPALLLNSTIWGQTDSVLALLALLAFLALGDRRFELAWILATLAVLTKPQALLVVPLFVLWPWGWWKSGRPLSVLLCILATVYVVADPFRGDRSWWWLVELYTGTTGYYAETSVNAMNLPALLFGMRGNDSDLALGLTAQTWGFVIGFTVGLAFLVPYLRVRSRSLHAGLVAAATLVAFMCLTRMHERYLYPYFVFAGLLGVTGRTGALYWTLSALFFANQLLVYLYQQDATAGPVWLWKALSALGVLALGVAFVLYRRMARGREAVPGAAALDEDDARWQEAVAAARAAALAPRPVPTARASADEADNVGPAWRWKEAVFLVVLSAVALGIRVWHIGEPTDLVFDEIYFVEQGRNYLEGKDFMDPHPPIAKLTIGLGIKLFGDTPTGWRLMNAAVGTALVPLMYWLARLLFRRRVAAAFAAALVTFDGLCIVDSRIAVIDIHYVTWGVAAYVSAIRLVRKERFHDVWWLLLTGALIGLSVAAKLYIPFFSFLLVLGTLFVTAWNFARRSGVAPMRYALWPVFVTGATASVVYALSYAPHFLWGWWHSPLDLVKYIVIKVPEYQAAVAEATHPYSSKWWTWPLLLRPVWYYWKDPGPSPGMVVGIWGSGNPPVWWAALPALVLAGWYAVRDRRLALVFVVAGWVIHLAPWVGIGRTLFLYHYLPSLLFGLLALSWMLDRLWHGEGGPVERGIIGAVLLGSILPVAMATTGSWGAILFIGLLAGYEGMTFSSSRDQTKVGRTAVAAYALAVLAVAIYFLPIWLGTPVTKRAWEARMWISGSKLMNWI